MYGSRDQEFLEEFWDGDLFVGGQRGVQDMEICGYRVVLKLNAQREWLSTKLLFEPA